jgi:hypothetical protein
MARRSTVGNSEVQQVEIMVDGEEQLFDPKHPVWRLLLVLSIGLLALGGVASPSLLPSILGLS